jgi:DNA-directed RNA polymerase specialized sigma24 family protein
MSFAEIGEKLNITENNAKVKCHRSVLKLKVVFNDL